MTVHDITIEKIVQAASLMGRQSDFQDMIHFVIHKVCELLHADFANILMINPKTAHTVKTISRRDKESKNALEEKISKHISGWILKKKNAFHSANICTDDRFAKSLFRGAAPMAIFGAPLWSEGRIIGTLVVGKSDFDTKQAQDEKKLLEDFAAVIAPFLHNTQALQSYFESPIDTNTLLAKYAQAGLLGTCKNFVVMLHAVEAAARCDVRVLLEGESGTGKELVAQAIHKFGLRSNRPFVAIDCGAIPENLVESELFGYVKGAFTGASAARIGLIEEAHNGTLFMDEIANLPMPAQAKLLRVLQEGKVRPVGGNTTRAVNVRIISASSSPLHELIARQQFREDLFYRLHVYPIKVPSLNERAHDIPILANYFLEKFASEQGKQASSFHEEIIEFIRCRHWKGNIRELENFVERVVTLTPENRTLIGRKVLPTNFQSELKKQQARNIDFHVSKSLRETMADYEEQLIRHALKQNDWNQAKTARQLKISPETLRYKMRNLGIIKNR